jgi:hypothetical protein
MGFDRDAAAFEKTWSAIYPPSLAASFPTGYRKSMKAGIELMVEVCCFTREAAYGGKSLSEVVRFSQRHVALVEEAADRLLAGETTGILPERFLIAAAQLAVRNRKADPARVATNFFFALGRA